MNKNSVLKQLEYEKKCTLDKALSNALLSVKKTIEIIESLSAKVGSEDYAMEAFDKKISLTVEQLIQEAVKYKKKLSDAKNNLQLMLFTLIKENSDVGAYKAIRACFKRVSPYYKDANFFEFTLEEIYVFVQNKGYDVSIEALKLALEDIKFEYTDVYKVGYGTVRLYYVDPK